MTDDQLIDQVRRAASVHFGKTDLLALEELLRRFKASSIALAVIGKQSGTKKEGEPKPSR